MSEQKHTPGPWRVDGLYLNQLGVWAGTGAIVAKVEAGSHENADGTDTAMTNEEYDANAALIAAAPDMYEALDVVWEALQDYRHGSEGWDEGLAERVHDALAKAEGR